MSRWTAEEYARYQSRLGAAAKAPLPATLHSKYHNSKITHQGQTFDSKHEFRTYQDLKAQQLLGAIRAVIRQVSMPLPDSRRRIRIDFLIIDNDGSQRWLDAKGYITKEWAVKAAIAEQAYGIKISTC
jgi:hypothetical protein